MVDTVDPRALPVLKLIRSVESDGAARGQGVSSGYDVVWGGIRPEHRPVGLSGMTLGEVLAWQDLRDRAYDSEAAGAYQIMNYTLRDIIKAGAFDLDEIYDAATQDRLAMALLNRRGWDDFIAGKMTAVEFGNSLAREWASFPVHTDQRGHKRWVRRGQSYYGGDGLNAAHAKPAQVLAALDIRGAAPIGDTVTRAEFAALSARVAKTEKTLAAIHAATA